VTDEELASGLLYPTIDRLNEVSRVVARAVMVCAQEEGVADPLAADEIERRLDDRVWTPEYDEYIPGP
jgi:malic enzyme